MPKAAETPCCQGEPDYVERVQRVREESGGRPLTGKERGFFEPRFGRDFATVRLHDNPLADTAARSVAARAYTLGSDVVFRSGAYRPGTADGQQLLAHELAHVVQQGESRLDRLHRRPAAERPAELKVAGDASAAATAVLQRHPDVGFVVRSLTRQRGQLDDPDDSGGNVSWPLSFSVTSPLEVAAEVEVTGAAGDPCTDQDIGFLQTVHTQWLHLYYWGQSAGHGSTIIKWTVPLPIRDGDPGTFWYTSGAHASPAGCGSRVNVAMDDYPTIFGLPKVHNNTRTGQPNYLTGVRRGMHFVTTLAEVHGGNVEPLRHFFWNYQMSIDFRPNYGSVAAVWPFTWNENRANHGRVHSGASSTVPVFIAAAPRYNGSIAQDPPTERT